MNLPGVYAVNIGRLRGAFLALCAWPALRASPLAAQGAPHGSVAAERARLFAVPLETRLAWNSAIPYSLNDGAMWAGKGWNVSLSGGIGTRQRVRRADLKLVIAPSLNYSQNRSFPVMAATSPGRSPYSAPFHGTDVYPRASIDLPIRFGDRHLLWLDPGRTSLRVTIGKVTTGITAENEWWGPGIRSTLIMSNNAPGIPRLFVGTSHFQPSRIGLWDAKLMAGTLTESRFFDYDAGNDYRALSGARVRLRPAFDTTLTLGFARVVYSPSSSPFTGPIEHVLDVVRKWDNILPTAVTPEGTVLQSTDQIMSWFARWIFPPSGFEVYGEWARMDLPKTGTELLVAGHHTGGYVLGFQWAQPRRNHSYLRLQSEVTYLEQSLVFPDRPPPDFYTGTRSPQGYTNRGQVIGAATGPGSSSQWIALDWFARKWQGGVFVGRIRWDNDALYRQSAATFLRHDVTMLSGLRGGLRTPFTDFSSELTIARRYNYLFQNGFANPGGYRTVDINNVTLTLSATPR